MSYCKEFFHKYEKDGNFCGLDKSQESRINGYLSIVKLLEKQDIPEDKIYKNFTVKAAEPLIHAKGEARTKGLNYVTSRLMDGEKITSGDLQSSFKTWGFGKPKKSCINATVEVPPAPVAQTLKERYSLAETLPPLSPDADMKEKLKRDELLLQEALSGKVPEFTTAAVLMNGGMVTKPLPMSIKKTLLTVRERDLMLDAVLERKFTPKEIEIFDDIVKAGGYGCRYDLFEEMVKKLEAP